MSTHRGLNKIPGTFDGLGNYIQAISDFTYLLGFWGAVILVVMALRTLWRGAAAAKEKGNGFWPWLAPGVAFGVMVVTLLAWIIRCCRCCSTFPTRCAARATRRKTFAACLVRR
jgi:hypothetical protein